MFQRGGMRPMLMILLLLPLCLFGCLVVGFTLLDDCCLLYGIKIEFCKIGSEIRVEIEDSHDNGME